jgi:GTPase Era involved in 16S rRNA processing
MKVNQQIRIILALVITVSVLLAVAAVLFITESVVSLWTQLQTISPTLLAIYLIFLALTAIGIAWIVWRLLVPRNISEKNPATAPPTKETIETNLEKARQNGVDVSLALQELQQHSARREAAEIYIAFFGEVSTGKSSLISALLPELEILTAVISGTTRQIKQYQWQSPAGDKLILTDMPGTNDPQQALDTIALEEAQRAHVVVYVCEGDLNRAQFKALQTLLALHKPLVLAVNKTDRYSREALTRILQRLHERLANWPQIEIVSIRSGGTRQVIKQFSDGREESVEQAIPPDVQALQQAIQNCIDRNAEVLETLRDAAVFSLVKNKLDHATQVHLRASSTEIINQYTRKAIVGALAAVSPGMDVLFQGYLGVNLVKELCQLYGVPAKEVDLQRFIQLVQIQSGKTLPLILALAGNTLKAFPGIGTVLGGLTHAVAYGLIFDTLGRAVSHTLESRGNLQTQTAITIFKEGLGENLESRARHLVELAASIRKEKP